MNKIKVCDRCLYEMVKRNGKQIAFAELVDSNNPTQSKCHNCERTGFDLLYSVEERTIRTEQEIIDYLQLWNYEKNEKIMSMVSTAIQLEKDYPEIQEGIYGYGCANDFDNSPFILEDEDLTEMKEIKRVNGLVLYEIIPKEV